MNPQGVNVVLWHEALRDERFRTGTARNSDRLARLKIKFGCALCGYKKNPEALDFDHVLGRGPKIFNLAQADKHTWDDVIAEVQKCQILCANCHREKSQTQRLLKAYRRQRRQERRNQAMAKAASASADGPARNLTSGIVR